MHSLDGGAVVVRRAIERVDTWLGGPEECQRILTGGDRDIHPQLVDSERVRSAGIAVLQAQRDRFPDACVKLGLIERQVCAVTAGSDSSVC